MVDSPAGFTLRHTLRGHEQTIHRIAWSRDGRFIASPSSDKSTRIWRVETGELWSTLKAATEVYSVAWSKDGDLLAVGGNDAVCLWDVSKTLIVRTLRHTGKIWSLSWAPREPIIVSISGDIRVWHAGTGKLLHTPGLSDSTSAWSPSGLKLATTYGGLIEVWSIPSFKNVKTLDVGCSFIGGLAWSPDNRMIACGLGDRTVKIWTPEVGRVRILEGHTDRVISVAFSRDGRLLASKSSDDTVRIWRCDNWTHVTTLMEISSEAWPPRIDFHPSESVLATLGEEDTVIRLWGVDVKAILSGHSSLQSTSYVNAKVVILGDTGVGKTGLGMVLAGQPYAPTPSTHNRNVWRFYYASDLPLDSDSIETREILLWDLAGQQGYRLVHQLHLNEVSVALVVFDSRSETDPFAGVRYWSRALQQAERVHGDSARRTVKFLVAARIDGVGVAVSRQRIDALVVELGFDGFFETSAQEGWNVQSLADAIRNAIPWNVLPRVNSNRLFDSIKNFLADQKPAGRLLLSLEDLLGLFVGTREKEEEGEALSQVKKKKGLWHLLTRDVATISAAESHPSLQARKTGGDLLRESVKDEEAISKQTIDRVFETCIGRVESRGLIRRLSFGNLVLLQPELLDFYATVLVNAAREEPDGLGCINEELACSGQFRMPEKERIADPDQEKLLLIATVEDLLRHEIALREGEDLVFPAQFTQERPDHPTPEGKAVVFVFEGPTSVVYPTLAVRLAHSGVFSKKDMWKNASTYTAAAGGFCGIFLAETEEGRGEISLFFDSATSELTRYQFEDFVKAHLKRRALLESIHRRRIYSCVACGEGLTERQAQAVLKRGEISHKCFCGEEIILLDLEERLTVVPRSLVHEMDDSADRHRDLAALHTSLVGKRRAKRFDVFLCHRSEDKAVVRCLDRELQSLGLLPWLDESELRPGIPWQRMLEEQIERIGSAAVIVGEGGLGPWQRTEIEAFLLMFVERGCPVIPVILPGCKVVPKLPSFLRNMTWVNFCKLEPNPLERLFFGITGHRVYDLDDLRRSIVESFAISRLKPQGPSPGSTGIAVDA